MNDAVINGITAGSKVRIKKGTEIRNTLKGYSKPYPAGRSYVVTVHRVSTGYQPPTAAYGESRPDEIVWIGKGGYWHYANLSDVELVTEKKEEAQS